MTRVTDPADLEALEEVPALNGVSLFDQIKAAVDVAEEQADVELLLPVQYMHKDIPFELAARFRPLTRAERKRVEKHVKQITPSGKPKNTAQAVEIASVMLAEACRGIDARAKGDEDYTPIDADTPIRFDDRLVQVLQLEGDLTNEAAVIRAANAGAGIDTDQIIIDQLDKLHRWSVNPTGESSDPFEVKSRTAS